MTKLSIEELFSVTGKTALVTGGSRGIGEMIAAGFLANGAKVYITARKAEACDALACRPELWLRIIAVRSKGYSTQCQSEAG